MTLVVFQVFYTENASVSVDRCATHPLRQKKIWSIMDKQTNYYFLSGLFFVVLLVLELTDIYGNSGWFKFFLLILSTTFLISGLLSKRKNKNDT